MKTQQFVGFILVFACVATPAAAADAPPPVEELRSGSAIERQISGSQTDLYDIVLAAGEYANVTVDQKGIDVVVRVRDADDKLLTEIDEQWTVVGQEQTTIVAGAQAKYRLTVRPRYPGAPAGRYLLTVAEIRPAADQDRWLYEAMQLNTTALYGGGSGKMQEARTAAARAVELGERALGPHAPYLGSLLMRVAVLDRSLGHPTESREAFQRAATIFEAAFTRNHPQAARAIEGIGHTYFSENDYAKAEALFLESQAILEKTLGPDHPRVMGSLLNMSVLHQNLEDPRRAISDLERALPIGEKFLDPEDFQITAMISNLGTFHRQLNDYDRAEPLLNRALQSIEKKFGLEHPFVATPLQELGIIARERKDYDNALALLWRAEAAREKALGLRNSQTADTMLVIASVHAARGDYAQALELQRIALDIQDTVAGPYHNRTLFALSAVARTFAAMDDVPCALEYQARMDQVLDKNLELNLAIGSEQQKLTYSESTSDRTDRTISLHVAKAPDDPAAAELALLVLLQRKLRVLDAMSNNLATAREGLNPEDQNLLDRLRETTAELAKVALSAPGKTEQATYRARLKTLEDGKETLEAQISAHNAGFRAEYRPVTVAAVRDAIPPAAALIEFTVYRPYDPRATSETKAYGDAHYIAYVLRAHVKVRWIDLGGATAIDETVARWRQVLRDPQQSSVDRLARILDRKVMQPVRQLIGDASHLLISPDGQLGLIPFEALIDDRGRYLIERYSITYLMSGRDLLRMRVPRPSGTSPVVIADPLFGEPVFSRAPAESKVALASTRRSVTTGDGLSTLYFAPLAGTREEARRIGALFPEARVFTGKEASKAALRRLDAPRILHVATHGFFLGAAPTTNPLLRSGLALSGANLISAASNDQGILTALEASTLNLWGTKLVTLSACDSGVGEVKNREGVYGLRRAFFLAGAETVVMSLWPISDYVTRQMMTEYYGGLKRGLGRGEALRQTQLAMLKRSERRHPFYWASFIQSGDWAPLAGGR